jgi:flagellar motility protein MotE (MotC chaperone)
MEKSKDVHEVYGTFALDTTDPEEIAALEKALDEKYKRLVESRNKEAGEVN